MFDIQLNKSIPILTADESRVSNTSSINCLDDLPELSFSNCLRRVSAFQQTEQFLFLTAPKS